jgi:hypothetical protein
MTRWRTLTAAAIALAPFIVTIAPAQASLAPGCQHATLTENSGNGPTLHIIICYALKAPGDDMRWQLVNDGAGTLDTGDVLIGYRQPTG